MLGWEVPVVDCCSSAMITFSRFDEILDSGAGRRLLDRRGTPDSICGPFGGAYSIVKHSVYRVLYATLGRVI